MFFYTACIVQDVLFYYLKKLVLNKNWCSESHWHLAAVFSFAHGHVIKNYSLELRSSDSLINCEIKIYIPKKLNKVNT